MFLCSLHAHDAYQCSLLLSVTGCLQQLLCMCFRMFSCSYLPRTCCSRSDVEAIQQFCFELFSSKELSKLVNVFSVDSERECVMLADMAAQPKAVRFGWDKAFLLRAFTSTAIHPIAEVADGTAVIVFSAHLRKVEPPSLLPCTECCTAVMGMFGIVGRNGGCCCVGSGGVGLQAG